MSAHCSKCDAILRPVGDGPMRRSSDWTVQYWDALAMEFLGGYGMYDDPMIDLFRLRQQDRTLVLCHPCADQFIGDNPWIGKAVRVHDHRTPEAVPA